MSAGAADRPPGDLHEEHDDFFAAGDEGRYEGGPAVPPSHHPSVHPDDLLPEHEDAPLVVPPTEEQLERRNRMTMWVAGIVGFFIAALLVGVVAKRIRHSEDASAPPVPLTPVPAPQQEAVRAEPLKAPAPPETAVQPASTDIELPTMSAEPEPAPAPEAPAAPPQPTAAEPAPAPAPAAPVARNPAPQKAAAEPPPAPAPRAPIPRSPLAPNPFDSPLRQPAARARAPRPRQTENASPAPVAPPSPAGRAPTGVPPTASFPVN
jgi:hypothetical protein